MTVKPIPDGYHSVTTYLSINGAAEAISFYENAFDAQQRFVMPTPDGKIDHAEITIGDTVIMLADACPVSDMLDPRDLSGTSVALMLYVADVDKSFDQALAHGAVQIRPVEDQFYGDRLGTLRDPFGHIWYLATHIEELTPEQISQRAQSQFEQ